MKKGFLGAALVLSVFFVAQPSHAAGLTSDQVSAIVSLLSSFGADQSTITQVQSVLNGKPPMNAGGWISGSPFGDGVASTSLGQALPPMPQGQAASCVTLSRNLTVGTQGSDVTSLQQLLASDPTSGFTATPNGFFGPQTAKAVAHFQVVNGIASSSTGTVGPLTRNFFEQRCGAQQPPMAPGGQPGQPGVGQVMVGGMVGGTINSVSGNTVTVQTPDGATRIVTLSASTTIEVFTGTSTPPTVGTISNLTAGLKIAADGKLNTDNSISALHVRVGTLPPPPPARTAPNMPGILKTIQSVLGQPAQGMSAQGGIQTQ